MFYQLHYKLNVNSTVYLTISKLAHTKRRKNKKNKSLTKINPENGRTRLFYQIIKDYTLLDVSLKKCNISFIISRSIPDNDGDCIAIWCPALGLESNIWWIESWLESYLWTKRITRNFFVEDNGLISDIFKFILLLLR